MNIFEIGRNTAWRSEDYLPRQHSGLSFSPRACCSRMYLSFVQFYSYAKLVTHCSSHPLHRRSSGLLFISGTTQWWTLTIVTDACPFLPYCLPPLTKSMDPHYSSSTNLTNSIHTHPHDFISRGYGSVRPVHFSYSINLFGTTYYNRSICSVERHKTKSTNSMNASLEKHMIGKHNYMSPSRFDYATDKG